MTVTVTLYIEDEALTGDAYIAYMALSKAYHDHRRDNPTEPFVLGETYKCLDGTEVTCIEIGKYECVRFSDGETVMLDGEEHTTGWRYNRDSDRGRGTACRVDNPRNVIPRPLRKKVTK
jgi:hypothetical protein